MKKRVLSAFCAAVMALAVLSGCGGAGEDAGAGTTKNPVTLKTVSMFGGTDANTDVYQAINKEFMEENSYITIEDNSQASDEDWKAAMAADFSVGNEPDVFQFFTDATAGTILATDKFVTLDEIRAEYPDYACDTLEAALDAVTNPDGVRRAVPTTGYWEGLFCNRDLFEKYDVKLPTDWASLVTAIRKFRQHDIIPIACSLNNVPHYWIEFLLLYTAGEESYVSVPDEAPKDWIRGLETFRTLRELGAFPEDTDTVDDSYTRQLFKEKKAAMQLDGSWYAGGIEDKENTVVIAFPGVENGKAKPGAMVGGISSGFYITKKAWEDPDKRDAAVKFVQAHTSKAGVQRYWEATGAISKAAVEVEPIDGMSDMALSALEYTNAATSVNAPTDARIGDAYKTLVAGIVKVSTGDLSAEELLNEVLAIYKARLQEG